MPEGDTIHRTAARLRPVLEGRTVQRFVAPRLLGDRPREGAQIVRVQAVGKNLLIEFDDGLVLHTHMKMTGSWHIYRAGEAWQRGAHLVRALIDVGDWLAVCFSAPVVQTYHTASPAPSPVAHLGPDLCEPDADLNLVVERMATIPDPDASLADVLLDQRVACGIGNVYKSEALWACRLSPFAPLASIDDDERLQLVTTAWKQLRSNLDTASRTTIAGGLAVYGRHRRPCRACSTLVEMCQFGDSPRSTYWCPTCQGTPGDTHDR